MSALASKAVKTFDELERFLDSLNYDLGRDTAVVVPRDGQLYFAFCTDPMAQWFLETGSPEERIEEPIIGEGGEEYRPLNLEWVRALGPYTVLHERDEPAGNKQPPAPFQEIVASIREQADAATEGPWFLSDCEGEIDIVPEKDLVDVTRDGDGRITGWNLPSVYGPERRILERRVDSWDEGEDAQDDQIRADARFMAASRTNIDILLDIVSEQQAALDRIRALADEIAEGADTSLINKVIAGKLRDVLGEAGTS